MGFYLTRWYRKDERKFFALAHVDGDELIELPCAQLVSVLPFSLFLRLLLELSEVFSPLVSLKLDLTPLLKSASLTSISL